MSKAIHNPSLRFNPSYVDMMRIIGPYIDRAVAPWSTGGARVYYSQHLAHPDEIWVELNQFPKLRFVYQIDPFALPYEKEHQAHRVGQQAFEFFRNRPTLPIDDNIVLGEN